ncbi:multicopper oxidase family protein [Actinomycetospora chiangmaiensis]|uniref:multicopper oxidase family protein n=1 Tax=Actinomycetospora chiangmaiensis TaxID=402650 RepID=UPI00036CE25C|nr:multicopper oxidase domain-containing protein [Actinomycetospora chiangmaiensis]
MRPENLRPYQDVLTFVPPTALVDGQVETVTIGASAKVSYSAQLPDGHAWCYDGQVPGRTFEVHQNSTVQVRWHNTIGSGDTLPFPVVVFPDPAPDPDPPTGTFSPRPQNFPGADGGEVDDHAAALTAATVTHLHGGLTAADSDGWTENVTRSGRTQVTTYGPPDPTDPTAPKQRSTLLWYHDHAIGVTHLDVYAGLFGAWIVRDDTEHGLMHGGVLPPREDERVLVIQDRNLALDADGEFTGDLLHKTETSTAEMYGPYTMVNGVLWPTLQVPARRVRLRILNGSNARTYGLRAAAVTTAADGAVAYTPLTADDPLPIFQVGTDGGLLDHPVDLSEPLPDGGSSLTLSPAERADVVVDFSGLAGHALAFVNTVTTDAAERLTPGGVSPANRTPNAHVLRFDVVAPEDGIEGSHPISTATTLDPRFVRYVHDLDSASSRKQLQVGRPHQHRWIALTENPTGNLLFRELAEFTTDPDVAARTSEPLIPIRAMNGVVTWYRTIAKSFRDPVRFMIDQDGWEVWNILNLTGDAHPVHVHLVQFQILTRQPYDAGRFFTPPDPSRLGDSVSPTDVAAPPAANEQGFKDTVRVMPSSVVTIAAQFVGHLGRYMYHCHILEHEDHDMMRPFQVVSPTAAAVMPDMTGMSM